MESSPPARAETLFLKRWQAEPEMLCNQLFLWFGVELQRNGETARGTWKGRLEITISLNDNRIQRDFREKVFPFFVLLPRIDEKTSDWIRLWFRLWHGVWCNVKSFRIRNLVKFIVSGENFIVLAQMQKWENENVDFYYWIEEWSQSFWIKELSWGCNHAKTIVCEMARFKMTTRWNGNLLNSNNGIKTTTKVFSQRQFIILVFDLNFRIKKHCKTLLSESFWG